MAQVYPREATIKKAVPAQTFHSRASDWRRCQGRGGIYDSLEIPEFDSTTETEPVRSIPPDVLSDFFEKKLNRYGSPHKYSIPRIPSSPHKTNVYPLSDPINADEVELLGDSSRKQCEYTLDMQYTIVWLLKKLRTVFAPILALLINISISQAILITSIPETSHHPTPRLEKPGLNWSRLWPCQLLSNLKPLHHLETDHWTRNASPTFKFRWNKSTSTADTIWFSTFPFHIDGCLKSLQRHCYSPWRRPHHRSLSPGLQRCFRLRRSFQFLLQVLDVEYSASRP